MKTKTFSRYLLALVSMVLLGTNVAVAQNTYELYNMGDSKTEVNTSNFFTYYKNSTDNPGYYTGYSISANNTTYTRAIKMESATHITFKTSAKSTVYIGIVLKSGSSAPDYSNETSRTVKLDGDVTTAISTTTKGTGEIIEIPNVKSGAHDITRNSTELGVFYVKVVEEESTAVELATPTIELNQATGQVTITPAENAIATAYTLDGTTPSDANGEQITEATTIEVNDGTIIKAISLGDDEDYISSDVVEKTMLKTGITIATPEIKSANGTFAITCASPNATITYSLDGSTYTAYERAITLAEAKTVYAKATREGCTGSEITTAKVDVLPSVNGAKTVYLSWGAFNGAETSSDGYSILNGKEDNAAYGWSIELTGNNEKAYTNNDNDKIVTPNSESGLKSIKLSNGAENTLHIPEGKAVTKLTFYSFINSGSRISGWKEVGGTNYEDNVKEVPMGATNSTEGKANPDVRSYNFDNAAGTITFTNTGEQLCFVLAVEYVDILKVTTADEEGYATFSSAYNVAIPEGVTVYGTEKKDENTIALVDITEGGVIPANTGVILQGTKGEEYTFKATTETAEVETILTANLEETKTLTTDDYVLGRGTNGIGFYRLASTSQIGVNKAYLAGGADARISFIGFGDDNNTTGIENIEAASAKAGKTYSLTGVEVAPNTKGLVIKDGKKYFNK